MNFRLKQDIKILFECIYLNATHLKPPPRALTVTCPLMQKLEVKISTRVMAISSLFKLSIGDTEEQ